MSEQAGVRSGLMNTLQVLQGQVCDDKQTKDYRLNVAGFEIMLLFSDCGLLFVTDRNQQINKRVVYPRANNSMSSHISALF